MKTIALLAAILLTAVTFRAYGAESSVPKPQTCMSFAIAKTDSSHDDAVAICYDGKKPALFYRFEVVEVPGKESGRVKVLVGWR